MGEEELERQRKKEKKLLDNLSKALDVVNKTKIEDAKKREEAKKLEEEAEKKRKEEAEAEAKKLAEAEAEAKEKALKVISKLIKNKKKTSALTPSYVPVELSQVANETLIEFNDLKNNKLSIKLINFL